jgi:hypothetical protein
MSFPAFAAELMVMMYDNCRALLAGNKRQKCDSDNTVASAGATGSLRRLYPSVRSQRLIQLWIAGDDRPASPGQSTDVEMAQGTADGGKLNLSTMPEFATFLVRPDPDHVSA